MKTLNLPGNSLVRSEPDIKRLLAAPLLFAAAGLATYLLVTQSVSPEVGRSLVADDGPVQLVTFGILVASSIAALVLARRHAFERTTLMLTSVALLIYAGREADLNKASWLPRDYANIDFYTSASVPLWQKGAFGLVMLSLTAVAVGLVVRVVPRLPGDLRLRKPWVLYSAIWMVVLVTSQVSDRSAWNAQLAGQAFEEILECIASGIVLLAVCAFPSSSAK